MKLITMVGLGTAGVGVLAVLAGVGLGIQSMARARAWKRTTATVLRAELESRVEGDGQRFFCNVYNFRYAAEGRTMESSLRSPMQTTVEPEMRARLERHAPGAVREVVFNPANPGEIAWAAPGASVPLGFAVIGLMFILAGAMIWYGSQPAEW